MMWNNSVELDDIRTLHIDWKASNVQVTLDERTFTYKRSLPMFSNPSRKIFFRGYLRSLPDHVVIIGRSWSFWHDWSPVVLWPFMFSVGRQVGRYSRTPRGV